MKCHASNAQCNNATVQQSNSATHSHSECRDGVAICESYMSRMWRANRPAFHWFPTAEIWRQTIIRMIRINQWLTTWIRRPYVFQQLLDFQWQRIKYMVAQQRCSIDRCCRRCWTIHFGVRNQFHVDVIFQFSRLLSQHWNKFNIALDLVVCSLFVFIGKR